MLEQNAYILLICLRKVILGRKLWTTEFGKIRELALGVTVETERYFWVGATYVSSWKWVTANKFLSEKAKYWGPGQPDKKKKPQKCAWLYNNSDYGSNFTLLMDNYWCDRRGNSRGVFGIPMCQILK